MNANSFVLENNTQELKKYLFEAYKLLVNAYNFLVLKRNDFSKDDENKLRDKLVKKAETLKSKLNFTFISEFINLQKSNRIDIALDTPYSLGYENRGNIIEIECKIISSEKTPNNISKYIDNKKSFKNGNGTNGIMSFITGKYAEKMLFAGMIGFVKEGKILEKINNIKEKINKSSDISTIHNLEYFEVEKSFNYSYLSKHKREKGLGNIDIYHLFFDFT